MKTLHTIYTSFAKRLVMLFILLVAIGIGNGYAAQETLSGSFTSSNTTSGGFTASGGTAGKYYKLQTGYIISDNSYSVDATKSISISMKVGTFGNYSANKQSVDFYAIDKNGNIISNKVTASFSKTNSDGTTFSGTIKLNSGISGNEVRFKFASNSNATSDVCARFYNFTITYESAPSTFTVTYNANGAESGDVPTDNQKYTSGASVTVLGNTGNLVKTGYRFDGWQIDKAGTVYNAGGTFNISENTTLYAKWTEKDLTNYRTSCTTETIVTLDPNGGTISNTDGWTENGNGTYSKTHEGTEIALPTATKTNYIFGGWYNGETKYESIPSDLDESITLTAKWLEKQDAGIYWDPESVTVTIDADGNILPEFNNPNEIDGIEFSSSNSSVVAVDANGVITLGSTGTTATVTITATFDGNETYAAKTVTCSITVHPSNCKWVETNIIEHGDEVVITMTGTNGVTYTFENTKNTDSAPSVVEVNNISGTYITSFVDEVKWVVNKDDDELTFKSYLSDNYLYCTNNNNGVRVGNTGSSKIFTIDNESGYLKHTVTNRYIGVYNNQDWRCYTDKDKFAGQTLKFYKRECLDASKVWVEGNLTNVTCSPQLPQQLAKDGSIELTFTAADGYELPNSVTVTNATTSWSQATGKLTISNPTDNVMVTVEAVKYYTVTWKPAGGNWSGDINDKVVKYEAGDKIVAPVTPTYDCHEFLGWTPAYPADMTMPAENLEFTATWNKLSYTITFKNYNGTVLQTSTVECGETPSYTGSTPTKDSDEIYDYEFAGWDPTIVAAKSDATYTATYNKTKRTYTVQWYVNGVQYGTDQTVTAGETATAPVIAEVPCGAVIAGWTDAEGGNYVHNTSTLHVGATPSIEIRSNKIFYAVFADLEGAVPEMPTVIAYWKNQELIKDQEVSATVGTGKMTLNIGSTDLRTKAAYFGTISTQPIIELTNLDLTSHQDICLSFWTRGSVGGAFTIETNEKTITTINVNKNDVTLYIIENIPNTTTSIRLSYGENSGSFFFGTVKLYEAPATYSFEKLTGENTNGWTGSDWDGYYLITNASTKALDGNAIGEYSIQTVEDVDNKIECSITTAFHIIYNSEKNGYSVQGVGDGDYLQQGNKTITVSSTASYIPEISYNSLNGTDYALQWNGNKCAFYASEQSAPQMYKIMSELSNHRTLCTYEITYKETYGVVHSNPVSYTAANLPLEFTAPASTREGYTFKGWSPASLDENTRGDQVVEAQWTVNQCVVTWKVNAQEVAKTTVDIANPLTTIPYTPADDALDCCAEKFIGWSTETNPTKSQVYTTASELQNLIGTLAANTTKTFHAVFATPVPGAGTSLVTFSEMGYANEEAVTSVTLGDGLGNGDATITFAKGTAATYSPTYYTIGEAVRTYAGNTITVAATYASTTLTQIDLTFAKGENANTITASIGDITDGIWTGNAQSVTFTIGGTTGHRRIASIAVTTEVTGDKYTNYVTKCDLSNSASIGAGTITYANSATAIDTKCGQRSPASKAATLTFASAQNLTCPVTIEATTGFLVSTNRNDNSKYASSIIVKPVKTGTNKGKLPTIYVRYEANFGATGQIHGTITATGSEIDNTDVAVLANVTCTQYTLTVVDHLGNTISTTNYYEGNEVAEIAQPTPDDCSKNYIFVGWSESAVEYGSLVYNQVTFPYTMPAKEVVLHPVYECNSTADYHRVTSDLGAENWAGDYLIAYNAATFANGKISGESGIGKEGEKVDMSSYINNNAISATEGDKYNVTLEAVTGGYVLKTKDEKYNYYTKNTESGISISSNVGTAGKYPIFVNFVSQDEINLCLTGDATGSVFRYNTTNHGYFRFYNNGGQKAVYLYKKTPLYTSSLICEEVTASDALVTSTACQTIKVNVPITLTSSLHRTTDITAESDNAHFTITNLSGIAEGNHTLAVHYQPTATTDGIEIANIKIKVNNLPVNTFQVTGRHLPQNFVIAAKAGNEWVALTAKVSSGTQVAVPIIVDNKATPTKASVALNTTQYQLFGLKTNNRYTANGTAVHLYSTQTQKVLNASTATDTKTYLNTAATQANAEVSQNALFYEWKLVSKDLVHYTITNSNQTADWENNRILGYSAATGMWGMYSKGTNINQDLFLLPVETVLTEIDMEVMEWGENSIALRIPTDAPEKIQVTLGENTSEAKALTNLNADGSASDLYKVEGLTLNSNDCEVMMITDADNTTQGTLVRKPIIITGEVESTTYTSDDCPHCDVVVLKDAKLKAGSSHLDFAKIYVYPGGKLVLDGNSLGVKQQVYLRGGYSWLNQETYALPEVYLNGSINFNGSGNIIYDYYIQNYKYYQFALPYTVSLAKVTDEAGVDNFPVWVKHYNGALRAADAYATSWEWYYGDNFERGEGYIIAAQPRQIPGVKDRPLSIIRFPLGNKVFNTTNGLESDLSIITKAHGIDGYDEGTVTANNVGWNFVGNPFLSTWKGDIGHKQLIKHPNEANWDGSYTWADSNVKYITIMSAESGSDYAQYVASETELKPFFPFFMQETAEGGTGSINFATANRIKKAPAELYADEPREAFVQIEIITDGVEDQTGIFVSDTYSDDIDFDDYEKMFGSSADKSKLWLVHDNKRMAFEAMIETSAAANIALGYRAPKTGSYAFAINEDVSALNEVMGVYLTDHELGVTDYNLLYNTYEFETEAANYNDKRFTIRIVLSDDSNGVVTGVDNIGTMKNGIYKFFYQDKMYIYNSGIIYDGTGKQVTNINK